MRQLKVIAVMALLSGCATTWHKSGASRDQTADDKLKCAEYARMQCGGNCYRWNYDGSMRECMEERGYSTEK